MAAVARSWLAIVVGPLVLIFLGILLTRLVVELLELFEKHEVPSFESNWGGLGRGLGGWSVNRTMVLAVLTLLVLLMFGSVTFELLTVKVPVASAEIEKKSETEKQPETAGHEEKTKPSSSGTVNPEPAKPSDSPTPPAPANGSRGGAQPVGKD